MTGDRQKYLDLRVVSSGSRLTISEYCGCVELESEQHGIGFTQHLNFAEARGVAEALLAAADTVETP